MDDLRFTRNAVQAFKTLNDGMLLTHGLCDTTSWCLPDFFATVGFSSLPATRRIETPPRLTRLVCAFYK